MSTFPVYLISCTHPDYGRNIMPYIGVVVTDGKTIEDRFKEHCEDRRISYLNSAIKKHGKAWFTVEQIDAGNTPEQALELEKFWIARLKTKAPNGYNLTNGGTGGATFTGHKHSEDTRQKMSATHKGKPKSEAHRQSLSAAKKGTVGNRTGHHEPWSPARWAVYQEKWGNKTPECHPDRKYHAKGLCRLCYGRSRYESR